MKTRRLLTILIVWAIALTMIAGVAADNRGRFTDVPGDAWYTEAVDWAVENGITNGVTPEEFRPNEPCTRAEVVTFLWRYDRYRFGGGTEEPTPAEPPEVTEPEITEPAETEPEIPEPPETEPVTEPEITEPTEPIPAETEPENPTEPEATEPVPYEPVVYEYFYYDTTWSGDEIVIRPDSGNRVSVEFPGIGAKFTSGDLVTITFDGSKSAYLRGSYNWCLDMELEQPITELLNQTCSIQVLSNDEILLRGTIDVDCVYVCLLGARNRPAMIRVEKAGS